MLSQTRSGVTNYYLQDGQNSTRALTNSLGAVTDTYSYTAFGELFNQTGSTANSYLYTGQQFDSLTGLYSLRARYYNPALGRFLSQDTYPYNFSNPIELNRYVYAANSPINLADPTGYAAFSERGLLNFFSRQNTTTILKVGVGAAVVIGAVAQLVGTQERTMTWQKILALEERQSQLAPGENPMPTVYPPPLPDWRTPSVPTPQPTETQEPSHKVLIVGEGDFSYTTSLSLIHPDWNITGSRYGDGSNNQSVLGTNGNVTFVNNVDARRLGSGAITGANQYDAIIFNNPYAGARGKQTASLISAFILSAQELLTPYGEIHINVTKQLLLDFPDVAAVLGLPNNTSATINNLPTFGQTQYFAPYIPVYSDGNIMLYYGEDPSRVASLKNFVFP